ncbi:MAG: DUF5818 domain-containing protein [Candidatus Sulfotelmatobacter sp.]
MKKQLHLLCLLGALAAFLSLGIALNAQQTAPQPGQSTDPQAQQPAQPPASQQSPAQPATSATEQPAQPNGVQAYSGTIVKEGDRYMLHDEATGQTYDLDHQDEVQKYAGKRVRVHGTLDPTGKMIHLQ